MIQKIPTKIKNLDYYLGGGFTKNSEIVVGVINPRQHRVIIRYHQLSDRLSKCLLSLNNELGRHIIFKEPGMLTRMPMERGVGAIVIIPTGGSKGFLKYFKTMEEMHENREEIGWIDFSITDDSIYVGGITRTSEQMKHTLQMPMGTNSDFEHICKKSFCTNGRMCIGKGVVRDHLEVRNRAVDVEW